MDDDAVDRARQLGRAVATQTGLPFDEVRYQGEPGVCPMCHLNLIVLRESHVECGACGAQGWFVTDDGGRVLMEFPQRGREKSILTMAEKHAHLAELLDNERNAPDEADLAQRLGAFERFDRVVRPIE